MLRDVAEVTGGLTKNAKRDGLALRRPYLTVANVYANRLELDDIGTIGIQESELARVEMRPGDLLVVEGNGSLSQLGRVAIWTGVIDGCVHQNHLIKVRPTLTGWQVCDRICW
jgi:type I restriction enzyme S subunit